MLNTLKLITSSYDIPVGRTIIKCGNLVGTDSELVAPALFRVAHVIYVIFLMDYMRTGACIASLPHLALMLY